MIKIFEQFSVLKEKILYHGTDIQTDNPKKFNLPMWLSTNWWLASHFALYPQGSRKKVESGFVYRLKIINPEYIKIDEQRIILNRYDDIQILKIDEVERDPIVFAKIKNSVVKENNIVDPYNEENWDDFQVGDELICKENIMTSTGKYWLFHQGKTYKVTKVTDKWIYVGSKVGGSGHDVNTPFTKKGIIKYFYKK